MKKFLINLWRHLGYWANPVKYHILERETKWKMYLEEIRYLAKEFDAPDIEEYTYYVAKKMEYDK